MHTSTRLDFMDEFIEDVTEVDGALWYRYGIEQRPVESLTESIWVLEAGELVERRITLYRTHHGPITRSEGEYWIATAMNWDPVPALIQSFERTKQTNLEGFLEMLEVKRNSSNNTVYADANGSVAYFHGNFVPRRNPSFDYDLPVPGWNPRTDWQGLHDISELVRVIDPPNGWVQNCNSRRLRLLVLLVLRERTTPLTWRPIQRIFEGFTPSVCFKRGKTGRSTRFWI